MPGIAPALPARFPLRLQDLRSQDARFCIETQQFMEKLAGDLTGSVLIIGCSGGADSLALLCVLRWLAPILRSTLHVAHVHHGLRQEAEHEARALAAVCRRLGVPFHRKDVNVLQEARFKGRGIEEAGRDARYAFFTELRHRLGADWICTAHQRDDLLEDVLMRLTRGTAWPGLSGMPALCPERRLLRPFLMKSRTDIENFLHHLDAQPVNDPSNQSPDYLRNRMRHAVVPLLLEENPSLGDSIETLWALGSADAEYWQQLAERLLPPHTGHSVHIPSSVKGQPLAVRLRLYTHAIKQLTRSTGLHAQTPGVTLFSLDAAFAANARNKTFDFPGDIQATLNADGIRFHAKTNTTAATGKTSKKLDPAGK